ncbi:hypothetical protein F5Y12DRAFT_561943 [Xylaria sp. FL1777]|nr:hypothetical protein F5Y12DRAFT_561943 [Xylaria sp. FL1777]
MAAAKVAAGGLAKPFRTGTKQIFLPSDMVVFLTPEPKQLPIFATFRVPMTFNKFDLRDYLLHVYRTPVVAVRSHIIQQKIKRAHFSGHVHRPPSFKKMTVQLTQPFVWPQLPDDVAPWKRPATARAIAERDAERERRRAKDFRGFIAFRGDGKPPLSRKSFKEEAAKLLKQGKWTNKRELDVRFTEKSGVKKS